MKKIIMLPVWLNLYIEELEEGLNLIHQLSIGYNGIGKLLDPLILFLLPKDLEHELNEHAKIEFTNLSKVIISI